MLLDIEILWWNCLILYSGFYKNRYKFGICRKQIHREKKEIRLYLFNEGEKKIGLNVHRSTQLIGNRVQEIFRIQIH